jgi:hypothetical protein
MWSVVLSRLVKCVAVIGKCKVLEAEGREQSLKLWSTF